MADIQYLNYGDLQIELLALLNNLANNVLKYVQSQSWSNKRKEKFMSAYADLMNRGIQGASNSTGQWVINVNGDDNFDSMSKKDKEMYQEAAYFIQQQMAELPTKDNQEKEKEEEKKNLPLFDNTYFTREFGNYISNNMFGGRQIDTQTDWNSLDKRDSTTGLRERTERAKALSNMLKSYSDSLEEGKYNFEGSPFENLTDFKTRVNSAIQALNTPDESDDIPALNAIGLRASDWFNNGSGDKFVADDGKEYTYGDYYGKILPQLEKDKVKAEAEKLKAQQANYWSGYKYYNLSKYNGRPLTSEESNLEHLNKIISKDKWSGDEASQIVQAFKLAERNGQLVSITDKNELAKFGPMWKNRVRQLRKINGIEGIYYDTVGKKFIKPYKNGQTPLTSFLDILDLNNPETIAKKKADSDLKLREQYAKRTEMTPQDWEYVASVIPDIASIPDAEPFSAATLAFAGAGMRHHALANRPGGMSTSDKWWLVADYLGAGLASIPGFGDAYLVGRILNTTRKFATGLFAAAGAYGLGSATVNAFGKWAKGEDMTLQEKMDVVMAIPSLVSAYRLRSREGLNDAAKAANLNNITPNKGKVKVTVTDESGNKSVKEITGLSELKSKELLKQFKNAGNDNSKKTQILKSDSEVLAKASELGIDLNKVSIETDSRHMASYRKPTEIEFYPETSPSSARTRYNQEIENLKNSGHNWQARRLLIYDKFYKGTGGARKESDGNWFKKAWHYVTDTPNLEFANKIKNGETPKTNSTEVPKTAEIKSSIETPYKPLVENSPLKPQPKGESSELFNIQRPIKEPKSTPNYGKKDLNEVQKSIENIRKFRESYGFDGTRKPMAKGFDGETIKEGSLSFEFGGEKITLKVSKSDLKGVDRKHANFNSYVVDIRNRIAKQIEEFSKKHSVEETSKLIEGSLKKGWLKQGGRIDKQKIQKYKEFIKK